MSNPGNIIGGHKATLHNPNVSDEAKQHSAEVLKNEYGISEKDGQGAAATTTAHHDIDGKNPDKVARGLKAAMHNPNVSDEAKQHSAEVLKNEFGITETIQGGGAAATPQLDAEGKNPENVARGLKAAMHNPNVSDEAKQAAEQRLADMK